MKHIQIKKSQPFGFSLTELLVVIAIITVLTTLGFMGVSTFSKRANAAKDATTLRQIWTCIQMYSGDHNDLMLGPLFSAQVPIYNKPTPSNPREWRRLSDCLTPYLRHDSPKQGDFIEEMAASWQKTPDTRNAAAYFMQQKLPIGFGDESGNPWGRPAPASADLRLPMRMAHVMGQSQNSRTWAITEVDQLHPEIPKPNLKTPEGMAHGGYRLGIYFDGGMGRFGVDNNPL
jgi:prepilin-type N-terminal cleavage/methylation domain-containing protein